uniref:Fucolectin tachylectin-4 pentraxin-1 domain-containing protein n=1 Tax=Kryptolebias marmoratus TaxID=37003 RepID=A0A3Q3EFS2_KRYMA
MLLIFCSFFESVFFKICDRVETQMYYFYVSYILTSSVAYLGYAPRAIDGNRDPEYSHGSCTHTNPAWRQWWRLLLPVVYRITSISITNRNALSERLNNVELLIGNSLENNGNNNPRCTVISSIPSGGTSSFNCTGMVGRVINVYNEAYNALTLCELEVYGG